MQANTYTIYTQMQAYRYILYTHTYASMYASTAYVHIYTCKHAKE